ncbi:MAG: glycosyltransferase family 2 protein [Deltaproteobacteria bacterium]|jgi:glycosyltransferase involved in cell wall biosynthesis|nr:glycosyltransferase family 2 protein [Deltaproteobacteria bacterium]
MNSIEVAILMCTYNGVPFLREQLNSIKNQTFHNWCLWVSDDGSSDETLEILKKWAKEIGQDRVKILSGPKLGFCQNFLSLTANSDIRADIFFWSDQDDIWLPKKIERAINVIKSVDSEKAVLYGGRTILVDRNNQEYGFSPLFNLHPPSLENALLQNLAGGNTIAFNQKARYLITLGLGFPLVSHDWWAYLVICGCGGMLFYDEIPMVRYRQHGRNLIGSNISLSAKLKRFNCLLNKRFKHWVLQNINALDYAKPYLTSSNRNLLENFNKLRKSRNFFERYKLLKITNVHCQKFMQSIILKIALLLKII